MCTLGALDTLNDHHQVASDRGKEILPGHARLLKHLLDRSLHVDKGLVSACGLAQVQEMRQGRAGLLDAERGEVVDSVGISMAGTVDGGGSAVREKVDGGGCWCSGC